MFLRRFQKRKNGKMHVYWALVESYRTARGSRQRVVSYLGELKESEQNGWAQLSAKLNDSGKSDASKGPAQLSLFDPPQCHDEVDAVYGPRPVLVDLKGIRLECLRDPRAVRYDSTSAHPCMLPRLRDVEDAGRLDAPQWLR